MVNWIVSDDDGDWGEDFVYSTKQLIDYAVEKNEFSGEGVSNGGSRKDPKNVKEAIVLLKEDFGISVERK